MYIFIYTYICIRTYLYEHFLYITPTWFWRRTAQLSRRLSLEPLPEDGSGLLAKTIEPLGQSRKDAPQELRLPGSRLPNNIHCRLLGTVAVP